MVFVVTNALMKMEIQIGVNVVHKICKLLNSKTKNFTVAVLLHATALMKMCIAQMEIFKAGLYHAIGLAQLPEEPVPLPYLLKIVLAKTNVLMLRISIIYLTKFVARVQISLERTLQNIVGLKMQRFARIMSLPKINSASALFLLQILCK